MKLTVIGGGGVRSMFLMKAIAQKAEALDITHVALMDNEPTKLRVYGEMGRQVAKRLAPEMQVTLTTDAKEAISGARYVITTIRSGNEEMRVRDERLALERGIIGQETTGAAGLSFAMRSVCALKGYCELVRQFAAPGCKVFNFTNPAGLVSQTLRDMGYDFTYGVCDTPSGFLRAVEKIYEVNEGDADGLCYGLNHLSYFSSVTVRGREVLPELLRDDRLYQKTDMRFFSPELAKRQGRAFNEYLYYYYYPERAFKNIVSAPETRAELIARVNKGMLEALSQIDIEKDFDKALETFCFWHGQRTSQYMANETGEKRPVKPYSFDLYSKTAGGYAGVALKYIQAVQRKQPTSMIFCVPNEGALDCLEPHEVAEISCDISPEGVVTPRKVTDIGDVPRALIMRVKAYERMASRALITHDKDALTDALYLNPLVNSYAIAGELSEKYAALNAPFDGEWRA